MGNRKVPDQTAKAFGNEELCLGHRISHRPAGLRTTSTIFSKESLEPWIASRSGCPKAGPEISTVSWRALLNRPIATALAHRLLAFSRRQPVDPRPTDVNHMIAALEDLLRRSIGEMVGLQICRAAMTFGLCAATPTNSRMLF
jgi:hypothetical protein